MPSLPVRGAWIEMYLLHPMERFGNRRSPCGERGLKCTFVFVAGNGGGSLPVRGAWIEICLMRARQSCSACRSPCGERGLKYRFVPAPPHGAVSLPVRGAWIEIRATTRAMSFRACRSPCGERGLKSFLFVAVFGLSRRSPCGERGLKSQALRAQRMRLQSLPVRGAWIEIERCAMALRYSAVAPRAGSVD